MSARELITEHLDLWTGAVTRKASSGRGSNGKVELTGIKKLRELILELAVRGKLVNQDKDDEPVGLLLEKIESEKSAQLKAKTIRKPKKLPEVQEIEQPFPIPVSWRYCRLNELGVWGSGATPKRGIARYYGGGIPWFKSGELYKDFIDSSEETITELAVQETSVRMNQPGDVLIAMYGATIGKASILEVAGTTNQAVCACTPWPGISNRFLLLLLKAYRSRFIAMGAGGAQPNISREKIIATVVGLPPEQEQHRIVQKVDELMALCDRLEQQTSNQLEAHETLVDTLLGTLTQSENGIELADNWKRLAAHFDTLFTTEQSIDKLKQTILQLAVMGRLLEQDAGDESAEELLEDVAQEKIRICAKQTKNNAAITDEEVMYYIPSGWRWARFGDVVTFKSELVRPEQYPEFDQVAPDSIEKGTARLLFRRTVQESGVRGPNHRFHRGQILYSKIRPSLSKAIIAPFDGLCSADMYPIQPILVEPRYLLQYILSEPFLGQVRVAENRVKMPKLNMPTMSNFLVAVPPLAEQKRIVEKVDELTALCDQLKERLNQAGESRCQLAKAVVKGALHE